MPETPATRPADPRLERVRRLQQLADLLDASFRVPGTQLKFGLDPILGLIPGIGDLASASAALYIVYESWRLGARGSTLMRMLGNIGVDFIVGAIPLLGDILDFTMKPNQRNLRLLNDELGILSA